MLNSLSISNLAVIREVTVDFPDGFTVLTGETGSGKSVFMSGIKLLLGCRADKDIVRNGANRAEVSAFFSEISLDTAEALADIGVETDEEGALVLSRAITADGRSAARINGKAVNLAVLKECAELLIGIHGQNSTRDLAENDGERKLLDSAALDDCELAEYATLYDEYCSLQSEIRNLDIDRIEKERMQDLLQYQIKEIAAVSPKEGEDETLFERKILLKNSGRIQKQAQFAYRALRGAEKGNAVYVVERASAALRNIADVVPEAEELVTRLDECSDMLSSIAEDVQTMNGYTEEDPERALDEVESRLSQLEHLKRKYGTTLRDVLQFYDDARAKLEFYQTASDEQKRLRKQADSLLERLVESGERLHQKRAEVAAVISANVTETLRFLDMPKAIFEIRVSPRCKDGLLVPDRYGTDDIAFLLAANIGEEAQPVSRAASGGELARIMLAIRKHLSADQHLGTMVYDEIDTGVSGKTARKIGFLLKESAQRGQIFCITHSAQIASLADAHFLVAKSEVADRVESHVTELDRDGRIAELSRILGGLRVTDAQRMAAIDMLNGKN